MTFDIQSISILYMSTILFYQNTSTMYYCSILKSSPSLRMSHLSPGQRLPLLPVNFILGAGGPYYWAVGHCNYLLIGNSLLSLNCVSMCFFPNIRLSPECILCYLPGISFSLCIWHLLCPYIYFPFKDHYLSVYKVKLLFFHHLLD